MFFRAPLKEFILARRFSWVDIAKDIGVCTKTPKRWRDGNRIEDNPCLGTYCNYKIVTLVK